MVPKENRSGIRLKRTKPDRHREKRRKITEEEKRHLLSVKRLPCSVCNKPAPSIAHHCLTGQGRKKDHKAVIPVCPSHHMATDTNRLGGLGRKEWTRLYGSEEEHLKKTERRLKDDNISVLQR